MTHNLYNKKVPQTQVVGGFSLIEVVISLFVLVVGVLATITLTVNSIKQTQDSRDSLIAASFAQEGMELARSIRDENATRGYFDQSTQPFKYFLEDEKCALDQASAHHMRANLPASPFACGGGANFNLNLDDNGRYNHMGSDDRFKRSLYFTNFVADTDPSTFVTTKSIDVISTVTYNGEPLPGPSERCSQSNFCVRNESTLTTWILH